MTNGLTSTVVAPTKIPTTLPNDRQAIQAAIKTSNILDFTQVKMVRIKNTLELSEIEVSEGIAKSYPFSSSYATKFRAVFYII